MAVRISYKSLLSWDIGAVFMYGGYDNILFCKKSFTNMSARLRYNIRLSTPKSAMLKLPITTNSCTKPTQ